MKKARSIAAVELKTLFYSPIAWLILVLFAVQSASIFTSAMKSSLQAQMMGQHFPNQTVWALHYDGMLDNIYLYIPLLTMGLMARETSSGSIKLLYSSPVSNAQIIFGKYLAMLVYGLLLTAVLASFGVLGFFTIKDIDIPVIVTNLAGIYLLISIYAAIGLFMSCLTSYQVAAAIGTLALFAMLNYVKYVGQDIAFVRDLTYWLSITGRAADLMNGLINSEDLLYFLIIISLFISLSILKLNTERFNRSKWSNGARFASLVAAAMVLGFITSRPALMGFYDVTRTKSNTLTPNSQQIVNQLKGPLTVTTYVNLFEKNAAKALPAQVNSDRQLFRQYLRFKPDMDLKYVYYYAQTDLPSAAALYPGLTDRQRMERACATYDLNPDIFLSKEQLGKIIDLSGEHYHFIRVLQTQDGRKAYLRLFNDIREQPQEREISAALKRLTTALPTVGFVQGHGARDINSSGAKGYNDFTLSNTTRNALINQGFAVKTVDLTDSAPIAPDIKIIVLADIQSALSDTERNKIFEFAGQGGNLLLLGEAGRQNLINPVTSYFGVSCLPGRLIQSHLNLAADLITLSPTDAAVSMAYELGYIAAGNGVVTMNGACGLGYAKNNGFSATTWFLTNPKDTWNELGTVDVSDDDAIVKPSTKQADVPYPTVLALARNLANRQQRIIIMGDANCLDNLELEGNRKGIHPQNVTLINAVFFWLSGGEAPIDVRRTHLTDNEIQLTLNGMSNVRLFFVWIMPALLGMLGLTILVMRRRQ